MKRILNFFGVITLIIVLSLSFPQITSAFSDDPPVQIPPPPPPPPSK